MESLDEQSKKRKARLYSAQLLEYRIFRKTGIFGKMAIHVQVFLHDHIFLKRILENLSPAIFEEFLQIACLR